jgi:hypothetical protein
LNCLSFFKVLDACSEYIVILTGEAVTPGDNYLLNIILFKFCKFDIAQETVLPQLYAIPNTDSEDCLV